MQPPEPAQPAELARYACTFCREKKIRCSRELPKCTSCRQWPGDCIYPARSYRSSGSKAAPRYV
ncbi:hypothetical protein B0I35DRAFT_440596, partial [Stachybotrys elegans]